MTHPSLRSRIAVPAAELLPLIQRWKSHAHAATKAGCTDLADVWLSAADEISERLAAARERAAEVARVRRRGASDVVEDRAVARQLKDTYERHELEFERLMSLMQTLDSHTVAFKETSHAAKVANRRACRAWRALDVWCDVAEINRNEL